MLQSLTIRDFVIVDRLQLEFDVGFSVLTGETGAGKSILIDALSLALGARAEAGVARHGCERAEVAAQFDVQALPDLQQWLLDNALNGEADELLMRRVVYADGKSRAFINGMAVTVQQLREAGDFLVDIYSQHAHHSLLKSATQRQILDQFAGHADLAAQVAAHYQAWHTLHRRRVEAEQHAAAYADELATLRDQARELKQLAPDAESWEQEQQEHARLSHGASLLSGAEQCRALIADADINAVDQLAAAQHVLQELVAFDPNLQEVLDVMEQAAIQLQEADRFLNRYLQRSELDPQRLAELEARIAELHQAARRYRVRPEQLAEQLQQWQARIAELELAVDDGQLARLEAAAWQAYEQSALQLSAGRKQAAEKLAASISAEIQRLALSGGRFDVALTPQAAAATGLELVEFLVAGHAGAEPRALSKVASGGELSRISLAIRVVTAQQGDVPSMIFDEVDVGIGGGVAEVVGQLLAQLGNKRQVLVITHLPQVAAQGAQHFRVSKQLHGEATLSDIARLEPEERVEEIARMLGGVEITATTRQHAREMLGYRDA